MYLFKAFKATEEPELCQQFKAGHVQVLIDYGIANVTTNNDSWMQDDLVYGVVAIDTYTNQLVGGIRVHISDINTQLPVEMAVGKMDPTIYKVVKLFRENGGAGELCALWNSKSVSGKGISLLLTRAGISIINQLKFQTLMGICADYTLKMFQQVGFRVNESLGLNGGFPYPNETYIAKVLGIMNAVTLETAMPEDKKRMTSLRIDPEQNAVENTPKGTISIKYSLIINKKNG